MLQISRRSPSAMPARAWLSPLPVVMLALSLAGSVDRLLLLRNARDVLTFTLVPSVLVLAGLAACWAPALRATRIDPASALRDE